MLLAFHVIWESNKALDDWGSYKNQEQTFDFLLVTEWFWYIWITLLNIYTNSVDNAVMGCFKNNCIAWGMLSVPS